MERGLIKLSKLQEILDILQEECGEVVTAVSKVRRFGLDNSHKDKPSQRANLIQELGDVALMTELLIEHGVLTQEQLDQAKQQKADKLRIWSNIYN